MNYRAGFLRLLIVATAAYCVAAFSDAAGEYRRGADEVGPASAWVVEGADGRHYRVLPPAGATPEADCARAVALTKAQMRIAGVPPVVKPNACKTLKSAAAKLRFKHGIEAGGSRLLKWVLVYGALAGTFLVVRWIWRGFRSDPEGMS